MTQKTDKELLELAAKACGYLTRWVSKTPEWDQLWVIDKDHDIEAWWPWNPLTNDDDALSLACHLCMSVNTGPCEATASTIQGALRGFFAKEETIVQPQDEAVRRAIVRAAAEIGEKTE